MVIFVGAQAAGKSSFYRHRFSDSHIRINLDMLKTRNRESILLKACLDASQHCVIDNTNATIADRKRYFDVVRRYPEVSVSGFYFQSVVRDCVRRNQSREERSKIPGRAIAATIGKLEIPSFKEGFASLKFVSLLPDGFAEEGWEI